jgi:hypothetical protein
MLVPEFAKTKRTALICASILAVWSIVLAIVFHPFPNHTKFYGTNRVGFISTIFAVLRIAILLALVFTLYKDMNKFVPQVRIPSCFILIPVIVDFRSYCRNDIRFGSVCGYVHHNRIHYPTHVLDLSIR